LGIREELPNDREAIAEVQKSAFGGDGEARLVNRLREEGLIVASIVAEAGDVVAGSAVFSRLPIRVGHRRIVAAALAPVAVLPDYQRAGLGSRMIASGIDLCREREIVGIIVLGDPGYYNRFGFSQAVVSRLESPYAGAHWMGLELSAGAFGGVVGVVEYPAAFDDL
jgi:putative acetyltransferase